MKLEDLNINLRTKEVRQYNINLTEEYIPLHILLSYQKDELTIKKGDIILFNCSRLKKKEYIYVTEVTENYIYGINQYGEIFAEPTYMKTYITLYGSITTNSEKTILEENDILSILHIYGGK